MTSPSNVPTSSSSNAGNSLADDEGTLATFGPNEWLVEEMYQQYLRDPASVDSSWGDFFQDYSGGNASSWSQTPAAGETSAASGTGVADGAAAAKPAPAPGAPMTAPPAAPLVDAPAGADGTATPGPKAAPPRVPTDVTAPTQQRADGAATPTAAPPSTPTTKPSSPAKPGTPAADESAAPRVLKGPAARVVTNMAASLEVPTATSVRAVPAKLLIDNRIVINNHLKRGRGGKVSFTHLIGFALVQAIKSMPEMNAGFTEVDGKPALVTPEHINLGLAIDVPKPDGTRQLLVPGVKASESMDFAQFHAAYEEVVRKARSGKLTADDFAGTTISLTNPGTIGTNHSVPRLMKGQGAILGVGSMDYPAEYEGTAEETLARLGVSKILTLTSTYDHRIIQGAQSGEFLKRIHSLLLGGEDFYHSIFQSLKIPYHPIEWARDEPHSSESDLDKPARIQELINAYRVRGHLMADTDPLEFKQRTHPDLDIGNHGLTLWDLDREFPTGGITGAPTAKLREILRVLRDSYCRRVGVEYMHIQSPEERHWIQERVEVGIVQPDRDEQLRILRRLNAAEAFETFLQTKYVGQKRFSLEGGESVIPLVDAVMAAAADEGLDEVCIGMPHRGRLNVLCNLAGKSYGQIFAAFEGNQDPTSVQGSGDVKYHLGTEGTYVAPSGKSTAVYLAANPSHLEAVDPVLEGIVRAKQDKLNKGKEGLFPVLPVLMHGDAAFAGQGVVAETLNLSQLRGYRTGGTVHVVINNQVGFTTSPISSRSSFYCTDVARTVQAPIFHVNGDDPEACVRVAKLAFDFRQEFGKDVVIDMVCYRRRGHNEADEPSFTQPLMYALIEGKRSVRKIYTEELIGRGDITVEEAEAALRDFQDQLERVFVESREAAARGANGLEKPAEQEQSIDEPRATSIPLDLAKRIGEAQIAVPADFTVHPKLLPLLQKRANMVLDPAKAADLGAATPTIDWAMGEQLAFGSLLVEGRHVRMSGQDCRRGTFGHRHAVIIDRTNGSEWTPLTTLDDEQGRFWIYDSLLSEFGVLGFEYGYSVTRPDALVLWEAQFGDFVDGAQTIIDEFISSGEQKWGQRSSVVLLLPHGYEGQGPDHSSARPERFLQMSAEDNMTIAWPTTPANYCHLLRRQAYSEPRRPLVVFSPKSMLRLKAAMSSLSDFTSGGFQAVLPDPTAPDPSSVRRVLLSSGKVHYDLAAERAKRGDTTTALLRLEQLAPLPVPELTAALAQYPNAELVWVQEEPANQGAWSYIAMNLPVHLGGRPLHAVTRAASASPAAGSSKTHDAEQARLVTQAFADA